MITDPPHESGRRPRAATPAMRVIRVREVMRVYASRSPVDPTGQRRINERLAAMTRRLSGNLWTIIGDRVVRTDHPTPTEVARLDRFTGAPPADRDPPLPPADALYHEIHGMADHALTRERIGGPMSRSEADALQDTPA